MDVVQTTDKFRLRFFSSCSCAIQVGGGFVQPEVIGTALEDVIAELMPKFGVLTRDKWPCLIQALFFSSGCVALISLCLFQLLMSGLAMTPFIQT